MIPEDSKSMRMRVKKFTQFQFVLIEMIRENVLGEWVSERLSSFFVWISSFFVEKKAMEEGKIDVHIWSMDAMTPFLSIEELFPAQFQATATSKYSPRGE